MNDPILDKLKAYFENTPREQVEKDWAKLSKWGEVGQPINEFLNENIMNKLELKHIVGYLPYDLKILDIETNELDDIKDIGCVNSREEYVKLLFLLHGKYFKSILRPMSDIVNPCLKDGKIPLVELAIIEGSMHHAEELWVTTQMEISYRSLYGYDMILKYDPLCGFIKMPMGTNITLAVSNQVQLFDYLYANHFDIYNLIEQNLAININTL